MAEGRRGLGRGLSALLDEVEAPAEGQRAAGITEIPVEVVKANPDQPRRRFDEAELDELAQSIREKGVLQPILVRPAVFAGQYQIVAGERRWRAAQRAGVRTIPALVRSLSDAEVLEIAIVENVQRVDLSPIEEAESYRALMDRFGRTQADVAQVVNGCEAVVRNLVDVEGELRLHMGMFILTVGNDRAIFRGQIGKFDGHCVVGCHRVPYVVPDVMRKRPYRKGQLVSILGIAK